MGKVAVITDSNSGITQEEAKRLGLSVLPMPFMVDGVWYMEGIDLTADMFFQKLIEGADISTSKPSIGMLTELWDEVLETHDEIVYIPMSSSLSSSYESAVMIAEEYDGKVQVVNNQRISVTQRQSAIDALEMAGAGKSAAQIRQYLEDVKFDSSIYIMLDTLKYIKKGGRITPAGAAIGSLLNIKAVLQIQGDKLDKYAVAFSSKQARGIMTDAIRKDFTARFADFAGPGRMWLQVAYTYDLKAAESFKAELGAAFPDYDIYLAPLALSVSCHIGPNSLAVACCKKIDCI